MKEIKVGEYVKTKYGHIAKVINVNDFRPPESKYGVEANYFNDILFLGDEDIVKHSPNIIDLIEEGDYVNGYKVSFIAQDCAKFVQSDYLVETGVTNHYKFYKESIKDIVTKEQFNQMKYIVGGEQI